MRGRNLMQARAGAVSMMCCATAMLRDSARFERNGERCYKPSQPSTVGVQQQRPGGFGSSPALPCAAKPLAERLHASCPVLALSTL